MSIYPTIIVGKFIGDGEEPLQERIGGHFLLKSPLRSDAQLPVFRFPLDSRNEEPTASLHVQDVLLLFPYHTYFARVVPIPITRLNRRVVQADNDIEDVILANGFQRFQSTREYGEWLSKLTTVAALRAALG